MPAKKTTSTKTPAKKTARTTKTTRTTRTTKPKIDTSPLRSQFEAIGGQIQESARKVTLTFEDRYTEVTKSKLDTWLVDNLSNINEIYERGDQEQWAIATFPKKVEKSVSETISRKDVTTNETQDVVDSDDSLTSNDQVVKDVLSFSIATAFRSEKDFGVDLSGFKNVSMTQSQICDKFGIESSDDSEICRILAIKGIAIEIKRSTSGEVQYIVK